MVHILFIYFLLLLSGNAGITLTEKQFATIVKTARFMTTRWRGLGTLTPCRLTHENEAGMEECRRCTPRPFESDMVPETPPPCVPPKRAGTPPLDTIPTDDSDIELIPTPKKFKRSAKSGVV
jgi:hypothetical protein